MKRNRLVGIIGSLAVFAMCWVLIFSMAGCSATQCANGRKALASARVAYEAAIASGNAKKIDRYRWTVDAAQAIVDIWCANQGEDLK